MGSLQPGLPSPVAIPQDFYLIVLVDDILLAHKDNDALLRAYEKLLVSLSRSGLHIAPEKVQKICPISYLGFTLGHNSIITRKPKINTSKLHTLHDFQWLLGDINWIRPYLKLSTGELSPLFKILEGEVVHHLLVA